MFFDCKWTGIESPLYAKSAETLCWHDFCPKATYWVCKDLNDDGWKVDGGAPVRLRLSVISNYKQAQDPLLPHAKEHVQTAPYGDENHA